MYGFVSVFYPLSRYLKTIDVIKDNKSKLGYLSRLPKDSMQIMWENG